MNVAKNPRIFCYTKSWPLQARVPETQKTKDWCIVNGTSIFRWILDGGGRGWFGFPHDIFHGNCLPHSTIPHLSLPTKFTYSKQSLTILEARVLGGCSTREKKMWPVPEAAGVPWEEGRLKKESAKKAEPHQPRQSCLCYLYKTWQSNSTDILNVCSCSPYRCQTSLTSASLWGSAQEISRVSFIQAHHGISTTSCRDSTASEHP